jgi:hypothetical protein
MITNCLECSADFTQTSSIELHYKKGLVEDYVETELDEEGEVTDIDELIQDGFMTELCCALCLTVVESDDDTNED